MKGSSRKILAVDIGAGTQDILLYDEGETPENCISMILPTPTRRYVQQIERCDHDLFINGDTIGGGGIASALIRHLGKGYRVTMTEDAAFTLRNSLEQVREYGIVIDGQPACGSAQPELMHLHEFDWSQVNQFLSFFGESGDIDCVAVAVQDHGVPPEPVSNRAFRFTMIEQRLKQQGSVEGFAFALETIPPCYKRMKAVATAAQLQCGCAAVAMDTCFAAILGCLEDTPSSVVVNVGNSHTVAATVTNRTLTGLMEHHTSCLTTEKLDTLLERFIQGNITSEEVLNDGGHGVAIRDACGFDGTQPILVTGPRRNLLKKSRLHIQYAVPHGNMMLTGPFGLIKGACHVLYPDGTSVPW
jgi:uncharacterized protein (DUF1786 family)